MKRTRFLFLKTSSKKNKKKEYEELGEKFKRECLKSYSVNRSGEVIKKFKLPSFQPLQRLNVKAR